MPTGNPVEKFLKAYYYGTVAVVVVVAVAVAATATQYPVYTVYSEYQYCILRPRKIPSRSS